MFFLRKLDHMNPMKYYGPLLAALIVYTLLSLFRGSTGFQNMRDLKQTRQELNRNLSELRQINQALNEELLSLSHDLERIIIQSRNLMYLEKGESILCINTAQNTAISGNYAGKILRPQVSAQSSGLPFKGIAFLVFAAGILLVSLSRLWRPSFSSDTP